MRPAAATTSGARWSVRDTIDALGPKDEAMLVVVDHAVRPLTPFVNDAAALERALIGVTATDTPGQLAEALRLAATRCATAPARTSWSRATGSGATRSVSISRRTSRFTCTRPRAATAWGSPPSTRDATPRTEPTPVYVRVENFAEAPAEVELSIWASGRMSERAVFTLDAGECDADLGGPCGRRRA